MLPCILLIFLDTIPELERHGLREAIVNVVERHGIDVVLSLPAFPFTIERNVSIEFQPWLIKLHKLFPLPMALFRTQFRLLIDDMLEMIHHRPVRKESQRSGKVRIVVLSRIFSEEFRGKGFRKEFHRHGVHLAGLHTRPDCFKRHTVSVQIGGKGVPRFMRNDLNIMLGSVEVREDKGRVVVLETRTVSSALLTFGREKVHQLILHHVLEKFRRFRRK